MIATGQLEQDLYREMTSVQFNNYAWAARAFASAYKRFAAQVLTGTGGRATNIEPGGQLIESALLGAYASQNLNGTANILAQALLAFWQMQPWAGGVGPGQTTNPGQAGVAQALVQLFASGTAVSDAHHHAKMLAQICTMGIQQVVITEYPPGETPKVTPAS